MLTSSCAFSAFLSPRSNEFTASLRAFTNSAGDFWDFPNNGIIYWAWTSSESYLQIDWRVNSATNDKNRFRRSNCQIFGREHRCKIIWCALSSRWSKSVELLRQTIKIKCKMNKTDRNIKISAPETYFESSINIRSGI